MKSRGEMNATDLDAFLDNVMNPTSKKTFPFSMYYSEGVKFYHSGQYDLAMKNFANALEIEPARVKTLLKRSRAYMELQDYTKARDDAMAAMKLASSSSFSEACDLKGKCEYFMGNFERGFLTYFRGRQSSSGSEKLRLGQQLCEEAIGNAMLEESEKKVDGQDIKRLLKTKGDCPRKRIRSRFSRDKEVLEELLSDDDLKYVHGICREGLEFIQKSEKFWTMQKPSHSKKKASLQRRRITKKASLVQHVISVKHRCQNYLQNEMASHCVSEGQKLMQFIESHPELQSDRNIKFKADILHLLGLAYGKEMKDKLSLNCFEEELRVAQTHSLVQPKIRAFHHLGIRYLRRGKLKKACRCMVGVTKALNSKNMKNFLKKPQFDDIKKESIANDEVHTDIVEVQAAKVWAQNFKSTLSSVIQDSIIAPAEYLLLDIYEEEMRTIDRDIILRHLYDSGSDDIENYLQKSFSKEEILK